jgi:hypothetical protein
MSLRRGNAVLSLVDECGFQVECLEFPPRGVVGPVLLARGAAAVNEHLDR